MFIKDFATREGVTPQAVYKLLKTHAKALEGHVMKGAKGMDLDEFAQVYLKTHMVGNPVVSLDRAQTEEIDRLQKEVQKLQRELIAKNQVLIEMQNKVLQIEEKKEEQIVLAVSSAEAALKIKLEEAHQADLEIKLGDLNRIRDEQIQQAVVAAEEVLQTKLQSEFDQVKKKLVDDHQADLKEKTGEFKRIRGEQNTKIGELRVEIDKKEKALDALQHDLEIERTRKLSFGEAMKRVFKK